uniref:Uncharacterized protein n=1 Tax=Haemonchus contortus TaxID=6289 RepID=W6NGC9_HAECO
MGVAYMASMVLQPFTKPQLDDVADTAVHNWLKDFLAVREQANWTVVSAAPGLPLFFWIGIVVLCCQLSGTFASTTWLKKYVNHPAGFQDFDFHKSAARSSGPVALPDFMLFIAVIVSLTVISWTWPYTDGTQGMAG